MSSYISYSLVQSLVLPLSGGLDLKALISIFELQLCHIMASNTNKFINRAQWRCNIMGIHVGRANINAINNTAQIWT